MIANLMNNSGEQTVNYICSFHEYDECFNELNGHKQNVFSLNKKMGNDISIPFKIAAFCRDKQIDIVHSLGWGTYAEGLAAAKLIGKRQKFIFSYRGKTIEDIIAIPKIRQLAQRFFSFFCDAILTNSEVSKKEYVKDIGISSEKISVLYNGVDIHIFRPDACRDVAAWKEKLGILPTDVVIGSVARLDPVKNLTTVLYALAGLEKDLRKKCRLLIVGDGPEKKNMMDAAHDLGLRNHIIFMGKRQDIPQCLNLMDIYVQPSLFENISNSVLEAMAAGLPVVSTNVGGIHEVVIQDRTGIVVPLYDQTALINAISSIVTDSIKRQSMGAQARGRVVKHFSIEKMASEYAKKYHEVVSVP